MSQLTTLKRAFDRGEKLTVLTAMTKYQTMALSQRCGEIVRSGYPLYKEWHWLRSGKRVMMYSKGRKP